LKRIRLELPATGHNKVMVLNWPGPKKIHLSTSTLNILAAFLLIQELTIHTADGL
jgi:hypothetical protein